MGEHELIFTNKTHPVLRVLIAAVGLFPLLAPYELLVQQKWDGFDWFMLFPIVISAGALLISAMFIGGGIFGKDHELKVSLKSRYIVLKSKSPVSSLEETHYFPSDISLLALYVREWDASPDTYSLKFAFTDGRKITVGDWKERENAESALEQVQTTLWKARRSYPPSEEIHEKKNALSKFQHLLAKTGKLDLKNRRSSKPDPLRPGTDNREFGGKDWKDWEGWR